MTPPPSPMDWSSVPLTDLNIFHPDGLDRHEPLDGFRPASEESLETKRQPSSRFDLLPAKSVDTHFFKPPLEFSVGYVLTGNIFASPKVLGAMPVASPKKIETSLQNLISQFRFGSNAPSVSGQALINNFVINIKKGGAAFDPDSSIYHLVLERGFRVPKGMGPKIAGDLEAMAILMNAPGSRDFHFKLLSHTDSRGREDYNQKLSQKRAEMVKTFLTLHGVAAERLEAIGMGEKHPLVPETGTPQEQLEARQKNRRIEVKVFRP